MFLSSLAAHRSLDFYKQRLCNIIEHKNHTIYHIKYEKYEIIR